MESAKTFKRKMLLWTNTWFQEELKFVDQVQYTPNATEIASLLQAIGYRVSLPDSLPSTETPEPSGIFPDCQGCRVTLMCPQSGRKIELVAPKSSSKCPSSNSDNGLHCQNAEINVETGDSVPPNPNLQITNTVSQLIKGIVRVMSLFPELNNNDDNETEKLNGERTLLTEATVQQLQLTPTSNCSSIMVTPSETGIAVVTPDAPRIPKPSTGDGKSVPPGRYRSLDTLISSGSGYSDELPEPGQLTPKDNKVFDQEMDFQVDVDLNATIVEGPGSANKKFISKSSPAFHETEGFRRSGTFISENENEGPTMEMNKKPPMLLRSSTFISESVATNTKDEPRSGPPPRPTPTALVPQSLILGKLRDVQNTINDIISMFDSNEKNQLDIGELANALNNVVAAEQNKTAETRPVRCLSDFGGVSNLTRTTTKVRSIPRLNTQKRSTTTADQVTPTTSRRESTGSVDNERKKSASTTALQGNNRIGQSSSSKLQKIFTTPSSMLGTLGLKGKESIGSPGYSTTRKSLTPNLKCANVQSSVSKTGIIRK